MFKYIGAFLGYYLFNLFGAFLGYFIGSSIDRSRAYGFGGINPLSHGQRQSVFIKTVFILMGKLAKADGQISQDEINHVEQFISQIGMSSERRREAINYFRQGSAEDFDVQDQITEFRETCGNTNNLAQMLMLYLSIMSLADGHLHSAEEDFLKKTAIKVGISSTEYRQMLDMVLAQFSAAQSSTGSSSKRPATASDLDAAYKVLGVNKDSSDKEIKRSYRKLISKYHPDKLIGQGVPEDMVKIATEQSKEIQLAYDLIERTRQ